MKGQGMMFWRRDRGLYMPPSWTFFKGTHSNCLCQHQELLMSLTSRLQLAGPLRRCPNKLNGSEL